jgi:uncharacterized damage-inducible protein DinB
MVESDGDSRPWPPLAGDETASLLGFLDYQRATFAWKCSGLTDQQLRMALTSSPMTLGGMLKHLASVEDDWFSGVVLGRPESEPWASVDHDAEPDWAWTSAGNDTGAELRALWGARVDRARAAVESQLATHGSEALAATHPAWLGDVSLRWVILHMIEEYARHNGHADLIREAIDGQTGE